MDGGFQEGVIVADRYRIIHPLGQGGSGTTYAAEAIGRGLVVALKRFRLKGASSWKALELFEREARVLASLRHSGIPAYLESFTVDGPEGPDFFLAQTLAEGHSLADWIASGARLGERDVRRIAEELLVVLLYLHGLNPPVVHRDIKPANVVLSPEGRLALVDFGAVREATVDSQIGGSTVVGTYGFMAPEQFRGVASAASDLYGLGATLVFLLTHLSPDRLPQKKLRPQIPSSLTLTKPFRTWLEKLLEPAPEDRFPSARAALTSLRSGRVEAKAGSSARVAILGGLLGVVTLGAGGTVLWLQKHTIKAAVVSTPPAAALKPSFSLFPDPPRPRSFEMTNQKFFAAHTGLIQAIAITVDGKLMATASSDKTAKIWSTSDWSLLHTFSFGERVGGIGFTADAKYVVATSADKTVHVWDVASGASVATTTLANPQRTLAVSPKGDFVVVAGEGGVVRSLSLPDLKPHWETSPSPGGHRVLASAFSKDGEIVATGGEDSIVTLRSASDGHTVGERRGHTKTIDMIAFVPDDTRVVSAADDGKVVFWDKTWEARKQVFRESATEVWALAFSPDGTRMFTVDKAGVVEVRAVPSDALLSRWERGEPAGAIVVTPDGRSVIIGGIDGTITVLSLEDTSTPLALPEPPKNLPDRAPHADANTPARQAFEILRAGADVTANAEAETLVKKALAANPKDSLALVQLSLIELYRARIVGDIFRLDDLAKANDLVTQALAANPRSSDAHIQRGWLLWATATTAALKKRNKTDDKDKNKGAEETHIDLTEARKEADLAEAVDPTSIRSEVLRSRLALTEEKYDEALRHATRSVESAADRIGAAVAYGLLIEVYRKLGMNRATTAVYQRELDLEPKSAWEMGNYAWFLLDMGQTAEGCMEIDKALHIASYGAGHATKSRCEAEEGIADLWDFELPDDARKRFEDSLKENPRNMDARYGLVAVEGYAAATKGTECASCEAALRSILEADPNYAPAKAALKYLGK